MAGLSKCDNGLIMLLDKSTIIASALSVIDIEIRELGVLTDRIDDKFILACELILASQGRIIVIGMGKSGHIGGKIAATLASTGTPAFFVHPGEASHGDMGMITSQDVVLALSNSGETSEVITLLPLIKRLGVPLIAMTGQPQSTLADFADVHLNVGVEQEACPLGLAPTSSTTVLLVMGDALAVALLESKGFTSEDFALSHPGGSLGKRLLMQVGDIMHKDKEIPLVSESALISDALLEMTEKKLGMTAIINDEGLIVGIFTDGDLRRMLENNYDIHRTAITEVMTQDCKVVTENLLAAEAMHIMEEKKINALIVVDQQQRPVGCLNMHDLIRAGIV